MIAWSSLFAIILEELCVLWVNWSIPWLKKLIRERLLERRQWGAWDEKQEVTRD